MGKFVNPDNSAFQKALNSKIYVDKTELLEYTNGVLDTLQGYICNSRPRRFGKSITADMLVAYYSKGCNSEKMFSDLKIGQSADFKKHLNQYDVIHLDIQWCIEPAGGPEQLVSYISQEVISELRVYYPDILDETTTSLPEALFQINTAKGNRFVVIIDEWDVLIRDEASDLKIQEQYINFLRGMFKGAAPTKYIQLAYLTGILPIKKIRTQSALNNFEEFSMIDAGELAPYIGFTENEVMSLCETYEVDFDKVKCWYDGYILGDNQIYNPKAVVSVLTKRKFKSYWSETGSYRAIIPLINMDFDGLKTAIIEMLSGAEVRIDVTSFQNDTTNFANRDDVLTYLVHLGYLGYNEDTETAFVQNEDVRQELVKAIRRIKWNMKKFDDFSNCLKVLNDADFEFANRNEIYRTGVIRQFNLTFEFAWKALQAVLRFHGAEGADTGSPREILQLGYKFGFINDSSVWLLMLKKRNLSVHIYNEEDVEEMIVLIRDSFITAFVDLEKVLEKKVEEVGESWES